MSRDVDFIQWNCLVLIYRSTFFLPVEIKLYEESTLYLYFIRYTISLYKNKTLHWLNQKTLNIYIVLHQGGRYGLITPVALFLLGGHEACSPFSLVTYKKIGKSKIGKV